MPLHFLCCANLCFSLFHLPFCISCTTVLFFLYPFPSFLLPPSFSPPLPLNLVLVVFLIPLLLFVEPHFLFDKPPSDVSNCLLPIILTFLCFCLVQPGFRTLYGTLKPDYTTRDLVAASGITSGISWIMGCYETDLNVFGVLIYTSCDYIFIFVVITVAFSL